jgi:acyl-CoA dehydrogenase
MFSFELSEEQQMIKDTIAGFARDVIEPVARECDEKGEVLPEIIEQGWGLEIIASMVPEKYGGFGEGPSAVNGAIAAEELAYGDLSTAMHLLAPTAFAYSILLEGTEEQKEEYLPLFCEDEYRAASLALVEPHYNYCPSAMRTTAVPEGDQYVLDGRKCLVPAAGDSSFFLVCAATTPGTGFAGVDVFIVPADAEGLTVSEREKNMGLKALETFSLEMSGMRLPAAGKVGGSRGADFQNILSRARLNLAALAVGLARRATEHSRDYARERVAFGEPIGSRQAIAFMIAEMAIETDATRLLVWDAACKCDKGKEFAKEAALAKHYADEMVMKVCDYSVQVMGGHGYVRDNPPELWFRNARSFAALEGMSMV